MKTFKILVILCSILIALTATTCEDDGTYVRYKDVNFINTTNDTIFVMSAWARHFTASEVIDKWDLWVSEVLPNEKSIEPLPDRGDMVLYVSVLKKRVLDEYSKEEIIEKDLVEKYMYTYDYLKWKDFNIMYTGKPQQDSISIKEEQYEK